MITSIDRDGTRCGYELDLIKKITDFANVPVIVYGGAGNLESVLEVIKEGRADAVSAASIFHYNDFSISDIKKYLKSSGINVRLA